MIHDALETTGRVSGVPKTSRKGMVDCRHAMPIPPVYSSCRTITVCMPPSPSARRAVSLFSTLPDLSIFLDTSAPGILSVQLDMSLQGRRWSVTDVDCQWPGRCTVRARLNPRVTAMQFIKGPVYDDWVP